MKRATVTPCFRIEMVHLRGDPASHLGLVGLIRVHQVDKGGIPSKHTLMTPSTPRAGELPRAIRVLERNATTACTLLDAVHNYSISAIRHLERNPSVASDPGVLFHSASETTRPNPSRIDFWIATLDSRWDASSPSYAHSDTGRGFEAATGPRRSARPSIHGPSPAAPAKSNTARSTSGDRIELSGTCAAGSAPRRTRGRKHAVLLDVWSSRRRHSPVLC